jgi:hypothetical protein
MSVLLGEAYFLTVKVEIAEVKGSNDVASVAAIDTIILFVFNNEIRFTICPSPLVGVVVRVSVDTSPLTKYDRPISCKPS